MFTIGISALAFALGTLVGTLYLSRRLMKAWYDVWDYYLKETDARRRNQP